MTDRTTPLTLHMHPLASYCWKVLLALYESDTPFRTVRVDGAPKENKAYAEMWPIAKMPLLQDGARVIPESSIIIEYLQAHHAGSAVLIPVDGDAAREVRLWDRFFDLYIGLALGRVAGDRLRPADFRAYLAHRAGNGVERHSLARALSVLRGFLGLANSPDARIGE